MSEYYVDFLNGHREIVDAIDKHDAVAIATKESGLHFGDIYKVYNASCFPDAGSESTPCIYCGESSKPNDLVCSEKCQRNHFGM